MKLCPQVHVTELDDPDHRSQNPRRRRRRLNQTDRIQGRSQKDQRFRLIKERPRPFTRSRPEPDNNNLCHDPTIIYIILFLYYIQFVFFFVLFKRILEIARK